MPADIRLLAFVEAATVTGPARNLLDFCKTSRALELPLEIHIATFRRSGSGDEFTDAVRKTGVNLTVIPERRGMDLGVSRAIRELMGRLKPDIVQTHAVKSHFLLAASRVSTRWIAFHHGYTMTDFKMRLYNQLDRWSLRRPSRLVTVSHAFERQLITRGIDQTRISVLQNSIAPDWAERVRSADAASLRRRLGLGDHEKAILAVGRMSVEKAHCDLIAAMHLLRRDRPEARLILVGDGPERASLEAMAGGAVIFAGQTADVAPYFAVADAMALPSLTEGSPNVLLEAMACGVPAVVTRVGGVPEMVTDGDSALLVPAQNPAEMAAALSRVLMDAGLRAKLTAASLELIALKHSVEARARALFDLYSGVLAA